MARAPIQARHRTARGIYLAVLPDGVGAGDCSFPPPVAPAVEIDGITADVFTDTDAVTVVGAVMLRCVHLGERGRIRGRHADPRCGACATPKDKAHHTEDTGQS